MFPSPISFIFGDDDDDYNGKDDKKNENNDQCRRMDITMYVVLF